MFRKRHLESKIYGMGKFAKVILILGARQVGKSTLLKTMFPDLPHIVFDAYQDIYNVKADPDLFLKQFAGPIILDEVQYVPELLSAIKRKVDLSSDPGQFYLTGSQNFALLRNLSETMAGRVAILNLYPMTLHEAFGYTESHWLPPFLQNPFNFPGKIKGIIPIPPLWSTMWRGLMPGFLDIPDEYLQTMIDSYVNTYIERDIHLIENIREIGDFKRFISLMAALSAQEINHSQLGRDLGITHTTAHRWKNLLEASFQCTSIPPYAGNTIKQLSKKEKNYLADTGIACALLRLSTSERLGSYPQIGAIFETFVLQQIIGVISSLSTKPNLFHWRSKGGAEVDLILERDSILYPIEIKMRSYVTKSDARGIKAFRETYPNLNIGQGLIIYGGESCYPVDEHNIALPYNAYS